MKSIKSIIIRYCDEARKTYYNIDENIRDNVFEGISKSVLNLTFHNIYSDIQEKVWRNNL